MRKSDKKKNMAKTNILNENRYLASKLGLNEMDYERNIAQNDFAFLQRFEGWQAHQTGENEFSIRNPKYPRASFDVSIAQDGKWDHSWGVAPNQEYPWKVIINAIGEKPYDDRASGHQGHHPVEITQTRNLPSSFEHFLKHTLPYMNH